jgi:hypothetical protein
MPRERTFGVVYATQRCEDTRGQLAGAMHAAVPGVQTQSYGWLHTIGVPCQDLEEQVAGNGSCAVRVSDKIRAFSKAWLSQPVCLGAGVL